jgi:hypothetical protein
LSALLLGDGNDIWSVSSVVEPDQVVIGKLERHNCAECFLGVGAGMVSDLDIWRAANLLIGRYGAGAELQAAQRADVMLDRGDFEGRLVWARIRCTTEALQGAAIEQSELKRRRASVGARNVGSFGRPRRRDLAPGAGPAGAAACVGRASKEVGQASTLEASGATHNGASRLDGNGRTCPKPAVRNPSQDRLGRVENGPSGLRENRDLATNPDQRCNINSPRVYYVFSSRFNSLKKRQSVFLAMRF